MKIVIDEHHTIIHSRCDIDLARDDGVIFMRRSRSLIPLGHSMMTGASMAGRAGGAHSLVAVRRAGQCTIVARPSPISGECGAAGHSCMAN